MGMLEFLRTRRTYRRFEQRPVAPEILTEAVDAAEQQYLAAIDDRAGDIESTFQSTVDEAFAVRFCWWGYARSQGWRCLRSIGKIALRLRAPADHARLSPRPVRGAVRCGILPACASTSAPTSLEPRRCTRATRA